MKNKSEHLNFPNLERYFLTRLDRSAWFVTAAVASGIPQWRRLAQRATLSAYGDCVILGLQDEAHCILPERSGDKPLGV